MKAFNLDLAKAGAPVCTAAGQKVRIVCWDVKDSERPLLALVDNGVYEDVRLYGEDGRFGDGEHPDDLLMVTRRHEGWVKVHKFIDDDTQETYFGVMPEIYETKEDAERFGGDEWTNIAKIEWEG